MARSFFITRASINSEDPTALEFYPAKGSDALHEALKEAFPFEANLAARMRAAVIEFLLQEQQAEQLTPVSTEYLPSPQSTFVSTMPSPALNTSRPMQESSSSPPASTQPSQEALMDVWSLPNKPQAKVHTRRTMTSDEKKAYKQKRLVGACADCKRRRRKCEHNNSAGGSSIVPQKVGKHKKRVASTAAPASKVDAMTDFSWPAPTFNFDDAFGATAMEVEPGMPSFDLSATDFEFSPDLSDDWQLFPDLPMATTNNNFIDSWNPGHSHYDGFSYTPSAGLSQSQVSTGSSAGDGLSQNLHDTALVHGGSLAGVPDTNIFASGAYGNIPISPETNVSQSPSSRSQSSSGDLYGHFNIGNNSSYANQFYSTGAHIDEARVSRPKPIQVPLPTPDLSLSVTGDRQQDAFANATTMSRSDSNATLQQSSSSQATSREPDIAELIDRGRLRAHRDRGTALKQIAVTDTRPSDAEANLLVQELLQSRRPATSSPAERTRATNAQNVSSTKKSAETSSNGMFGEARLCYRAGLSTASSVDQRMLVAHSGSNEGCAVEKSISSRNDYSLGQAPICVAAYTAYCALAQSSGSLAVLATFVLGALMLAMLVSSVNVDGKEPWSSALSSARQYAATPPGSRTSRYSNMDNPSTSRMSTTAPASWTRTLSTHLRLLRATAMV